MKNFVTYGIIFLTFLYFSFVKFKKNPQSLPLPLPLPRLKKGKMATTSSSLLALPSFRSNCKQRRPNFKVRAQISGDKATSVEPVNGSVSVSNVQNPKGSEVNGNVKIQRKDEIELLWDDGYGSKSVKDYFAAAREILKKPDGGPPRWFSPVDCGQPIKDAPTLFFLPGKKIYIKQSLGFFNLDLLCLFYYSS